MADDAPGMDVDEEEVEQPSSSNIKGDRKRFEVKKLLCGLGILLLTTVPSAGTISWIFVLNAKPIKHLLLVRNAQWHGVSVIMPSTSIVFPVGLRLAKYVLWTIANGNSRSMDIKTMSLLQQPFFNYYYRVSSTESVTCQSFFAFVGLQGESLDKYHSITFIQLHNVISRSNLHVPMCTRIKNINGSQSQVSNSAY